MRSISPESDDQKKSHELWPELWSYESLWSAHWILINPINLDVQPPWSVGSTSPAQFALVMACIQLSLAMMGRLYVWLLGVFEGMQYLWLWQQTCDKFLWILTYFNGNWKSHWIQPSLVLCLWGFYVCKHGDFTPIKFGSTAAFIPGLLKMFVAFPTGKSGVLGAMTINSQARG